MPASPSLSGELGLLSLFDLGQLFLLNGASGELCVTREGRRGYFYFDRGQIVNAVDDEYHEGDGAAFNLFTWRTGTFEFRAGPPQGPRAVTEGTEGLMLEAARRMDELGLGEAGQEAKLKQRASALDALREAFQAVARETGTDQPAAGGPSGSPLARLETDGDVLLLRPGRRARVRRGGAWSDAGAVALDPGAYDQLRARLLDAAATGARDGVRASVTAAEDGRHYAVARVPGEHEALWVRLAEVAPPALASLPGGDAIAAQLAGATGLLLVAAPQAESCERFFHACVAHLAATRGEALLLVSDSARWALGDGSGAVLRAAARDAEAVLRTCAPGVAAFEAPHAALAEGALGAAPLVVAGVVAADPGAALGGWCARAGRRPGDGIEAQLEPLGVTVAFASGTAAPARLELSRVDLGAAPPAPARPAKRAA